MRFFRRGPTHHNDYFAFRLVFGEPGSNFCQGSAFVFFVNFGYFAGNGAGTLRPEEFDKLLQGLGRNHR